MASVPGTAGRSKGCFLNASILESIQIFFFKLNMFKLWIYDIIYC